MMTSEESSMSDYTQISLNEERFYIFTVFVLGSIAFVIALYIYFRLRNILKLQSVIINENESNSLNANYYYRYSKNVWYYYYYRLAIITAQISVVCSMIYYSLHLFFGNNLLIPWNFVTSQFISISDSFIFAVWFFGKLMYYFSFTYHIQAIFNESMSLSLKIWMVLMTLSLLICSIFAMIIDASTFDESEIGITVHHNFNIGVPAASDKQSDIKHIIIPILVLTDIIYFGILLFIYVFKLRKIGNNDKNRNQLVKGIILISFSCLTFWNELIFAMNEADSRHLWYFVDVIFNDVCLYLMFAENDDLYQSLCCCLHPFCNKMITGKTKYEATPINEESDEINGINEENDQIL